jgi:hypothetical protein
VVGTAVMVMVVGTATADMDMLGTDIRATAIGMVMVGAVGITAAGITAMAAIGTGGGGPMASVRAGVSRPPAGSGSATKT